VKVEVHPVRLVVGEERQRSARGDRGVLLAQTAGGGVAGWRTPSGRPRAGCDSSPRSRFREKDSPRTSTRARTLEDSSWGTLAIRRTFSVTSSPIRPSPRVAARTEDAVTYSIEMQSVDLRSTRKPRRRRRPQGFARARSRRATRLRQRRCRGSTSARLGHRREERRRRRADFVKTESSTFTSGCHLEARSSRTNASCRVGDRRASCTWYASLCAAISTRSRGALGRLHDTATIAAPSTIVGSLRR